MRFKRLPRCTAARALIAGLLLMASSSMSASNPVANSNDPNPERTEMQEHKPLDDRPLVAANTKFGFKLYAEVLAASAGNNVLISPSSVGLALAMTYNGAEGETKEAMARALELRGLSLEEVNNAAAELQAALDSPDAKVRLEVANSLWSRKGYTFKPEFIGRIKRFYAAEVADLDFNDPGAPARINGWVNGKTRGKIDRIVDAIKADTVLFLINAIYFKGSWSVEFDPDQTKEGDFNLAGGRKKRVPMMHRSGTYRYLAGDKFQAVSLPYGDGRVSMYIFLPGPGASLQELHHSLTAKNWQAWMAQFEDTPGDIALPRFKVAYEIELNAALKALGMRTAFEGGADFSGMISTVEPVSISRVKHKTFAEVNEEGTEAAAVTSVEIRVTSMPLPGRTFHMVVDRPFFFAIRDNHTGTMLFMGALTEPL